jgi:dihydropteroate synthase
MRRPSIVGIINLTPDSFSGDGVSHLKAIEAARGMVEAGAEVIDVGAESTRPDAVPVTAAEEIQRLVPFLAMFSQTEWAKDVRLSVDTRHAQTAAYVLDKGAAIVNDVSGLTCPAMRRVLANHSCDIVVMHALTIPANKAVVWPTNIDPVAEILQWKRALIKDAAAWGIHPDRFIFDPGIGFGKTAEQSLALALNATHLKQSGGRWLLGHSRKSFLTLFSNVEAADRDPLTLAFSSLFARAEIDYLRVHAVRQHAELLARVCT